MDEDNQYIEEAKRLLDADSPVENVAARLEELEKGPFLVTVDEDYDLDVKSKVETASMLQMLGPSRAMVEGIKVYKIPERCPECGHQPDNFEEVTFDE